MIKHTVKDDLVSISIANTDFSYRIPTKKIGNTIDWRIGKKGTEGLVIPNTSIWTVQIFTKKTGEAKYIRQFIEIIKEYCPDNTIDWDNTMLAIHLTSKYNWLTSAENTSKNKMSEEAIIESFKKKHNLD